MSIALAPVGCTQQTDQPTVEVSDAAAMSSADTSPEPAKGGLTRNQKIAAGTAVGVVGVGVVVYFALAAVAASAFLAGG